MATSAVAQPSPNETAAAVLLDQGRGLAAEQPDVALGMYRAAIHLTPNDPAPRLLAARILLEKSGCTEAIPELRTWLSLVEQPPPDPEQYTQVVMLLSDCLRQGSTSEPPAPVTPRPNVVPRTGVVPKADIEPEGVVLKDVAAEDVTAEDIPLLELVDDLPPPPMPMSDLKAEPAPKIAPDSVEPQTSPTELEVVIGQPGWTCRLGDYVCEPDENGEILVELSPGEYTLACDHTSARPISQPVTILEGQRVRVTIGAPTEKKSVAGAPRPKQEAKEDSIEPMFGLGLGPSFGVVGLAGGVRFGSWSVLAGTGIDPLALSATWHVTPGATGLYLTGGWIVLGNGILREGHGPTGHGIFGGGGVEVRFQDTFLVRLGAGLQFDNVESGNGPLTFDLSVFWMP